LDPIVARTASTAAGLICGYRISRLRDGREIYAENIENLAVEPDTVTWLHFNLANARARQQIARAAYVPEDVRSAFCDHDARRCVERVGEGFLAVLSDLTFEAESDPVEVGTLWTYTTESLLITGRNHPLLTPDTLRTAVRNGLRVGSGPELLNWMLAARTTALRKLAAEISDQVGQTEDEILGGRIRQQREQLGRIRRLCAQLRRHFSPDRTAFRKMLQQQPAAVAGEQLEAMRTEVDDLSYLIDEANELYERAKLLQEELAARVAESTGRNLYVLAILTAVFLPMTLITGIFGMNVAGLPGLHDAGSFWWVMVLIGLGGAATLAAIFWRKRD
jgi:zinc transporter